MAAVTSVGITRTNWLASLKAHFAYPKKDGALISLYKEVLDEHRKPTVEEHLKYLSAESMNPAWRWLALRDADNEDKMVEIIQKGDRALYHRIKAYEQAKTEDQLHAEFSVDQDLFLEIEKHFKLIEDEESV